MTKLPSSLYIGKDLNLPAYSRHLIDKWAKLNCWDQFASGKLMIGRKSSYRAALNTLLSNGVSRDTAVQFLTDCIVTLRLEQRSK